MISRWLLMPFSGLLLAGCMTTPVAPPVTQPLPELQASWLPTESNNQPDGWLDAFEQTPLKQLVDEALAGNPALAGLRAQLRDAEAQLIQTGAAEQLSVDADLQAGRRHSNGLTSNRFAADLTLGWEIDLWQRLSASSRSAHADRAAVAADLYAGELSLAANVAKAWFSAVESEVQLRLSEQLVSNLKQSLQIVEENYLGGLVSALDIHLARANLATEEARLAERRQLRGEKLRALELLLGRYPAASIKLPNSLPAQIDPPPAGLPSEILLRRPDLRAAAHRLVAAEARVDARHADRYPRFRLTGTMGSSSNELAELLRNNNLIWNLFANLSLPLLDGDRLAATEAQAVARLEQAQSRYVETVLNAFAEVENGLAEAEQLASRAVALKLSVHESERAERLASEQYQLGLVDIVTVLESQRRAFNARSSLLGLQLQQLVNRINLYLALGGDFAEGNKATP